MAGYSWLYKLSNLFSEFFNGIVENKALKLLLIILFLDPISGDHQITENSFMKCYKF